MDIQEIEDRFEELKEEFWDRGMFHLARAGEKGDFEGQLRISKFWDLTDSLDRVYKDFLDLNETFLEEVK